MDALAGSDQAEGLPDVDNRAPALAGWVSGEVDTAVRLALLRRSAPFSHLVVEPVRLAVRAAGERRWERQWKLVNHLGIIRRVAIEVSDGAGAAVTARVDSRVIGESVPPWIERHRLGIEVSSDVDAAQRRIYREALVRSIELVVTQDELIPQY
jgi:hypothetical protein